MTTTHRPLFAENGNRIGGYTVETMATADAIDRIVSVNIVRIGDDLPVGVNVTTEWPDGSTTVNHTYPLGDDDNAGTDADAYRMYPVALAAMATVVADAMYGGSRPAGD